MDPTTKWTLLAGAAGGLCAFMFGRFLSQQLDGVGFKSVATMTALGASVCAVPAFVALSMASDVIQPKAQEPATACAASAPPGKTAVYTRNTDGSFNCTYKPT